MGAVRIAKDSNGKERRDRYNANRKAIELEVEQAPEIEPKLSKLPRQRTLDELVKMSFSKKMRAKDLPMQQRYKAWQTFISVNGSARAGHGDFEVPVSDVTISEIVQSYWRSGANQGLFNFSKFPFTLSSTNDGAAAVEGIRKARQLEMDANMDLLNFVCSEFPSMVHYVHLDDHRKEIYGFQLNKNNGWNGKWDQPAIGNSSAVEPYIIGQVLSHRFDTPEWRKIAMQKYPVTFAGESFNMGYGESMLVHIPTMREQRYSMSAFEQTEHSPEKIREFIEKGVIVKDRTTTDKDTEWVFVRQRQGLGVSDGLSFIMAAFLGGLDTAVSHAHGDRADTYVKFIHDYAKDEFDEEILETIIQNDKSNEVVERYHLDHLVPLFIALSAKGFSTEKGKIIYSSTGMLPNYRKWPEHKWYQMQSSPISHVPDYEESSAHVLDKKFDLPAPITLFNLASAGQQMSYNTNMASDWIGFRAGDLVNEAWRRIDALRKAPESFFPTDFPEELYQMFHEMKIKTFVREDDAGKIISVQRHLLPFDLREAYPDGKYL